GPAPLDPADLLSAARAFLPEFMVPSALVFLPELPLLPSGKVDRKALPAPAASAATTGRAPATEREAALCRMFADILGLPEVGADDGFFDLGGHSLLIARLVSRIRKEWGVDLPMGVVIQRPTPEELAEYLD
ncbi:MAG: hypothetical protein HOW97_27850, partial [Catenulispora sp.]|nr:hypothetical protein [Catenulispora sp.]